MTSATLNPIEAGLSGLVGLSATRALLLMIDVLTDIHSENDNSDQAIVIDLTTWQPQADSRVPLPVEKQQQPDFKKIPKTIPKEINSELAENTRVENSPLPTLKPEPPVHANNEPVENPDDAALPVPVPLFKLTETPRFLHQQTPEYPEALRTLGKTGHVTLSVLIDKFGRVRNITVLESDADAFSEAAIKAIMASSFIPAKIDGEPVAVKLKLPVTFKLL